MNRSIFLFMFLCISFLLVSVSVNALTGSIGNARMILRPEVEPGKVTSIEKSVLVKNVNNVSVNIVLEATGDLADATTLFDREFTLLPGEEKKAKFVIDVDKPGFYETKVNVFFTPVDEKGPGVVLSSTIMINAKGEGEFPEEEGEKEEIVEEVENVETEKAEEEDKKDVGVSVGAHTVKVSKNKLKVNPLIVIFIILAGIVAGFTIFLKRTNG